jgi:hypothetical protein
MIKHKTYAYLPSKIPNNAIFDRLQVLGTASVKKRRWDTCYVCRCSCGNEKIICGRQLVYGKTKSCGCLQHEAAKRNSPRLLPGEAAFNRLFYHYKWYAKRRKYTWSFTKNEFKTLSLKPCHYCGTLPAAVFKNKETFGGCTYNGIDRKDNGAGYTPDNSVPCCKQCNFAKRNVAYTDFISWLKRAAQHLNRNK